MMVCGECDKKCNSHEKTDEMLERHEQAISVLEAAIMELQGLHTAFATFKWIAGVSLAALLAIAISGWQQINDFRDKYHMDMLSLQKDIFTIKEGINGHR